MFGTSIEFMAAAGPDSSSPEMKLRQKVRKDKSSSPLALNETK
jgi:hypothetical protein